MTMTMTMTTNQPVREQFHLAITSVILDWFKNDYTSAPDYQLDGVIKTEQTRFHSILNTYKSASLLYCEKTGQPIGQLFEHAKSTHIPICVSPTWINTNKDDLTSKINDQPLALLSYLIARHCVLSLGVLEQGDNTISKIVTRQNWQQRTYAACVNENTMITGMTLLALLDYVSWARGNTSELHKAGLASISQGYLEPQEVLAAIARGHARRVCTHFTATELRALLTLETSEMYSKIEEMIDQARPVPVKDATVVWDDAKQIMLDREARAVAMTPTVQKQTKEREKQAKLGLDLSFFRDLKEAMETQDGVSNVQVNINVTMNAEVQS